MTPRVEVIKLSNGQEIIAKSIGTDSDSQIFVSSPLLVVPMRDNAGNFRIELAPFSWIGNTDAPIALSRQHVVCRLSADSQMESQYLAGLAGIALPSSGAAPAPPASTPRLTLVE